VLAEQLRVYTASLQTAGERTVALQLAAAGEHAVIVVHANSKHDLEFIRALNAASELSAVIVATEADSVSFSLACVRAGAQDVLPHRSWTGAPLMRTLYSAVERKRAQAKLRRLAHYDKLTGLLNRALFEKQLHAAVDRATSSGETLALLFIDLDGFKAVNDTLGHHEGDRILTETAACLRQMVRVSDLVARWGGDEFVILMPSAHNDLSIAEKLIGAIDRAVGGGPAPVAASVGLARYPDAAADAESLIAMADAAMYEAKKLGGGNVVVADPWGEKTTNTEPAEIELELRYVPVMDLLRDRVVGLDTHLLWQHPTLGTLEGDALDAAAERELMRPRLTAWMVTRVCEQLTAWRRLDSAPTSVTVRLCRARLTDPSFRASIAAALYATEVRAIELNIEISVADLLADPAAMAAMRQLREEGHRAILLASSVEELRACAAFPACFDAVKVRRAGQLARSDDSAASFLVSIAHKMVERGGDVIATDVETADELEILCNLGCGFAQGSLFSNPLTPASATNWIAADCEWDEPTVSAGEELIRPDLKLV